MGDSGKPKGRAQGTLGSNADEFAPYNLDTYAELIVDHAGIHMVPDLVKLFIRVRSVEHICLIYNHTSCGEVLYKNNKEAGICYGSDLNCYYAGSIF